MYLAEHMVIIWNRSLERILDTRYKVTRTKLNLALFDTDIELD